MGTAPVHRVLGPIGLWTLNNGAKNGGACMCNICKILLGAGCTQNLRSNFICMASLIVEL